MNSLELHTCLTPRLPCPVKELSFNPYEYRQELKLFFLHRMPNSEVYADLYLVRYDNKVWIRVGDTSVKLPDRGSKLVSFQEFKSGLRVAVVRNYSFGD